MHGRPHPKTHAREQAGALSGTLAGVVPLLSASFLFGIMSVCVRLATREASAVQVAFFRFAGSLLVLLVATGGRGLRPRDGNLGRLVGRGLTGAAAIVLYFTAIHGAGAGLAALLQSTYPVFAALLASVFLREPFSRRLALALGLNLAGAAAVVGAELGVSPEARLGMLAAAGSAVLAGAAVTQARHLRATENASLITTYFMLVGAVVTAPSLLAGLPPANPGLVAAVLGVVLTSVAGQWLLHHGLGFVGAAQGSLVATTSVVTAAALEAVWFGESIDATTIAGGALMIAAIGLASGGGSSPAAERPAPRVAHPPGPKTVRSEREQESPPVARHHRVTTQP